MSRPVDPITGTQLIEELQRLPKEELDKRCVFAYDGDENEARAILQVDLSISDRIDLNMADMGEI